MRYILSEDVKHILLERFILREDEGVLGALDAAEAESLESTDAKKALADLEAKREKLPNMADIRAEIEKDTAADANKAKAAEDAIKDDAFTGDLAAVKNNIKDFLKLFIDVITLPGKTAVDAENRLKQFEPIWNDYKRLRDIANNKEHADLNAPNYSDTNEVTKLKDLYTEFSTKVNDSGIFSHLVDNWPEIDKLLTNAEKAVNASKETINNTMEALTDKEDVKEYDLSGASADTLQNITKATTNLIAHLPTEDTLITKTSDGHIDITETVKQLTGFASAEGTMTAANLTSATEEWSKAIQAISEDRALADDSDALEKKAAAAAGRTDWAAEFAKASEDPKNAAAKTKAVWERYWEEEWGDLAQKAQNLGEAFTDLLISYGFDATKNPWVAYAKYCLEHNYPMDRTSIIGARKAYTRGLINNNALRHKDALSQRNANVLYCADLYKGNDGRIVEYLNLQKQILDQYNTELTQAKDKENTFNAKYKNNLNAAYSGSVDKVCLLINGIFNNNFNALTKRATNTNIENAKLKDINAAFQEFKACFGKDAKAAEGEKPTITDAGIADIVSRNATRMPQLIAYYIIAFQKETGTKLANVVADAGYTGLVYPRFDEVENFSRLFNAYKIDSSNVVNTLKKLLATAKAKGISGFENIKTETK